MLDLDIKLDLQVRSSLGHIAKETAWAFAETIADKPRATILIGTGGTMEPVHGEICRLITTGAFKGLNISQVVIINLDEYLRLPHDHPQSYHTYMDKFLYGHMNFNPDNIYIPDGMADPEEECARLNDILDRFGPPDLLLTGCGAGGHLGFVEDGTYPELRTFISTLSRQTRLKNARFFDGDISQVPRQAITIGPKDIFSSKRKIVIANDGKKKAVRAVLGRKYSSAAIRDLRDDPTATLYVEEKAFPYSLRDLPKWKKISEANHYVPA